MITYLATKNQGKVTEIRAMLADCPLELRTYPAYADPEEGHESYVANALLKARALRAQLIGAGITDAAVLADDSGIELDALSGAPGVDSAIYAGAGASWPHRLASMLADVQAHGPEQRGARFVCVMAFIRPAGDELVVQGDVRGEITQPRGEHGFGYDPVFFYPPIGKTFGEIPEQEKNELSHRGRATRALIAALAL
jgi:XTP/dITP diphosphohydrolase